MIHTYDNEEANPILIHTYSVEERGVPLSDEDVARGHLEDGWVPVTEFNYSFYSISVPADAPTGTLTFFECMWPVFRYPCGTWATNATRLVSIRKFRVPIQEDEELVVEPIAIEDVRVGMVIACKANAANLDHTAVCYGHTDNGPRIRLLSYPIGNDTTHARDYDIFVVCKRFHEPFVLK